MVGLRRVREVEPEKRGLRAFALRPTPGRHRMSRIHRDRNRRKRTRRRMHFVFSYLGLRSACFKLISGNFLSARLKASCGRAVLLSSLKHVYIRVLRDDSCNSCLHGCFSSQSFWKAGAARKASQTRSSPKMPALQNLFFSWTYQNLPLTLAIDPS
jgi:hypothetical protein